MDKEYLKLHLRLVNQMKKIKINLPKIYFPKDIFRNACLLTLSLLLVKLTAYPEMHPIFVVFPIILSLTPTILSIGILIFFGILAAIIYITMFIFIFITVVVVDYLDKKGWG